jgi:hypothetical protein
MKNLATLASKRTDLARHARRAAGALAAALLVFTAPTAAHAGDGIVVITPAGTTAFGGGCGGQSLTLDDNSRPTVGNTNFALVVEGTTDEGAVGLVLGTSKEEYAGRALPLGLAALGHAGCELLVSIDQLRVLPVAGTSTTFALPIPDINALMGLTLHAQGFAIGAVDGALSMSNGLTIVVGA